jgi:ribosomal protein S4E
LEADVQTVTKEETYTRSMKVTLAVVANGGSVAVQLKAGTTWVTTDTFYADGGYQLNIPPATIRIVPTTGASFEVFA